MKISNDRLAEYIDAFERAQGIRLSPDEALEAAMRVLAFVELLSAEPGANEAQPAPSAV